MFVFFLMFRHVVLNTTVISVPIEINRISLNVIVHISAALEMRQIFHIQIKVLQSEQNLHWNWQANNSVLYPVQVSEATAALPWGGNTCPLHQSKAAAAPMGLLRLALPLV